MMNDVFKFENILNEDLRQVENDDVWNFQPLMMTTMLDKSMVADEVFHDFNLMDLMDHDESVEFETIDSPFPSFIENTTIEVQTITELECRTDNDNLKQFIKLMEKALNNSNFIQLSRIFDQFVKNNCSILSKFKNPIFGHHLILDHYQMLISNIANYNFQFFIKTEVNRLIVMDEEFSGTISNDHEAKSIWKSFEILSYECDEIKLSSENKLCYDDLVNNKPVFFKLKLEFSLILNEERTLFTNVFWREVSLQLY
jgi:hypothetical protein